MHRLAGAIAAAGLLVGGAAGAWADQPGRDWMSKDAVKQQMERQGYSGILMEADDGHWEGEAIKDGRIVEFHADAHTGKITKSKPKAED
jgi:hypothetical protein